MVNTDIVNEPNSCANHAHFCEYFLVFACFLCFKNPVKYELTFEINCVFRTAELF